MSTPRTEKRAVSRWDVGALALFAVAGLAIIVTTVVGAVIRIVEVLRGTDVPVYAVFDGTPAEAPIGPDGAPVTVTLDAATVIAPTLQPASIGALIVQQVIVMGATTVAVSALIWLALNLVRQRVFSPTNTVLVSVAGFSGLAGVFLSPFFGNMGANGAIALISDRTVDNHSLMVDLGTYVLFCFVVAIACLVFAVGQRLQREQEGLV